MLSFMTRRYWDRTRVAGGSGPVALDDQASSCRALHIWLPYEPVKPSSTALRWILTPRGSRPRVSALLSAYGLPLLQCCHRFLFVLPPRRAVRRNG